MGIVGGGPGGGSVTIGGAGGSKAIPMMPSYETADRPGTCDADTQASVCDGPEWIATSTSVAACIESDLIGLEAVRLYPEEIRLRWTHEPGCPVAGYAVWRLVGDERLLMGMMPYVPQDRHEWVVEAPLRAAHGYRVEVLLDLADASAGHRGLDTGVISWCAWTGCGGEDYGGPQRAVPVEPSPDGAWAAAGSILVVFGIIAALALFRRRRDDKS